MSEVNFKCGFVGIVGPTNAGKSTLLNALVGKKVSIVSEKVQTTYNNVRGILNSPESQVIFVDTPGLQNDRENLARLLNKVASHAAAEADLLVWVFDCSRSQFLKQMDKLAPKIRSLNSPDKSICVLNKVDKVAKETLLPILEHIAKLELFSEIIPLSAKKASGVDRLLAVVQSKLPEGPALFATDSFTDRPMEFLLKETVREKIYEVTHQELPYSVYIEMEPPQEEGRVPEYRAVIHVDSPSRKGIIVGKSGRMLKMIGTRARADMEKLLGKHICLKLHVDLEPGWRGDTRVVESILELQ
jgi:GTPase